MYRAIIEGELETTMATPQPISFVAAAAEFAAGKGSPRGLLERCLARVEEFEPAAYLCRPEPLCGLSLEEVSLDAPSLELLSFDELSLDELSCDEDEVSFDEVFRSIKDHNAKGISSECQDTPTIGQPQASNSASSRQIEGY